MITTLSHPALVHIAVVIHTNLADVWRAPDPLKDHAAKVPDYRSDIPAGHLLFERKACALT